MIVDNQGITVMPVQLAHCDGKPHMLGHYNISGQLTFTIISHASSLHFLVWQ